MANKIYLPITLMMVGETVADPFYVKRYDNQSICFSITLQNYDGSPYNIPDGAEVRFLGTKRDGAGFGYTCTDISGNTCIALIPAEALDIAGACIAEIFVKWTDGYIRSQSFYFIIEDVACPEETIVSSDNFTYLEERTAAIDEVIKKAQEIIDNGGGPVMDPWDLPKVFLTGNIAVATKKNKALMSVEYNSPKTSFKGACTIKWQGTSSIAFPKKNFTIKLYTDLSKENKLKVNLNGWGKQNKFCLKANYIDHSHARNVVSARLWGDMVAARVSVPELMADSPNKGAIDGFPIKLYVNGIYQGLYTWNIPKDGWMFDMDDDVPTHAILCAEIHDGSGAFRENALIDESDWSLEFPDDLNPDILTSFNNMINHVKDTDDTTFVADFSTYLDLEACIDYYCLSLVMTHLDGLGKNMLMITYDGVKWFPSMYDMDSTWGLYFDGSSIVSYAYLFPNEYQCYNSLLWERLRANYAQQIYDRYMVLRSGALSIGNIISRFERFMDHIPSELYSEDLEIFPDIPSAATNNIKQIRNYAIKRGFYSDCIINSYLYTNMFNPDYIDDGFYIRTDGVKENDGSYYTSWFIPATEGHNYTLSRISSWGRMTYYDKNEICLGGNEGNNPVIGWAPLDTRLIRISIKKSDVLCMLNEGNIAMPYAAYGENPIIIPVIRKNLFDKAAVDADYFVEISTGNENSDGNYYTSAYMGVTEGNDYTISGSGWSRIAYYDKEKKYIIGFEGNAPLTGFASANTKLARISIPKSCLNTTIFELGSSAGEYIPY